MSASGYSVLLAKQCQIAGLPVPALEVRFHPSRRWRFDCAWVDRRIYAEVDGGTWIRGRHTRGGGFERDAEKLNCAAVLGWRGFRFTPGMVRSGVALNTLRAALEHPEPVSYAEEPDASGAAFV